MGYLPGVPVLQGINLQISPGKRIGLVGLTGGGKTTLVSLIPRFYDLSRGQSTSMGLTSASTRWMCCATT